MAEPLLVESLEARAFGALRGRTIVFGTGATVVLGANEAGKSSLFEAFSTLLFGFRPKALARHPYAPFDGSGRIEVDGVVRIEGTAARWSRVLDASGPSFAREGDAQRGNEPVTRAIAPALWSDVHRIGPEDLAAFGARPTAELRRLLTGDSGEAGVGAARTALDAERARLWRSSRRAKRTRVQELDAELARLSEELTGARATETGLVELEARVREDRRARVAAARRVDALAAEHAALELVAHVAQLVRDADLDGGVRGALEDTEDPGPLLAALEEAEERLGAAEERLAEPRPAFGAKDRRVLAAREEIERALGEAVDVRAADAAARAAREEAEALSAEAEELELAAGVAQAPEAERVAELGVRVAAWAAALEGDAVPAAAPHGPSLPAAAGVGAAAAAAAALSGNVWVGAGLALVAPVALALLGRTGGVATGATAGDDVERLAREARHTGRALGLPEAALRAPSVAARIAEDLARASLRRRRAARARERAQGAASERAEAIERWDAVLNLATGERIGTKVRVETALAAIERLGQRLAEAQRAAEAARADRESRAVAEADAAAARDAVEGAQNAFARAAARLADAVADETSPERAFERIERTRAARARLESALAALAAARPDDWERAAATEALDGALQSGRVDRSALREAAERLAGARADVAALTDRIARAEERLAVERPPRSLSELVSDRAAALAERRAALDAHDRLALLSAVLAEGERRHRTEHVPRILERAGAHVATLTEGRWSTVGLTDDDDPRLVARGEGGSVPVDVPLSRGLREQIHLCVRLAAAEELEHAGHGGATLPLILDEVFAHWDAPRRARGLALLAPLARNRQVILFTCHREWAEEAAEALGAPLRRL